MANEKNLFKVRPTILYLMLKKKYDTSGMTQDVVYAYDQRHGDAREEMESLGIVKKYISTS